FQALLADIAAARRFINIEYYIIADDKTGNALARALEQRARAGVKVRIIYDHVGSFKTKKRFFKSLREAGVEAYPFFEVVFPPFGTRINWRNHRKICVIDGVTGYIGGMNVADRYVDGGKNFNTWRDLHLRIQGPAVASLQQAFAFDWNFMGRELLDTPVDAQPVSGNPPMGMQLITGGPTSQWMNLTLIFQQAISNARKCVYIQTPYFLPSEGLLHALEMCALAKVDVRIMIPRRSDSDMLRWASFSYISECLRAGIKFYLYDKGMLHSKAIIIDDSLATVGSCNFDFRSLEHNFEANMLIYSHDFNTRIKQIFLRDQADSIRVTADTWRRRPLVERGMESFMRLFAPIL
ncbi:MAG: cardiolipin synthase, partial [Muribaculaceae bacterium]|nr:cardiolipin synthase [Muribaculaceae bacterium]